MCPVHLDREKTTNLSQATNKLNNRATRCVQYTWTERKPPICLTSSLINLITEQEQMCPVHLDWKKTTNLSQATNKLNNRTTRCVQYTWTGRKPPICHKPLINLITEQDRCVQYTWTGRKPPICHKPIINLITEQEDVVFSTHGPRENHQSVTNH